MIQNIVKKTIEFLMKKIQDYNLSIISYIKKKRK